VPTGQINPLAKMLPGHLFNATVYNDALSDGFF